MFWTGQSSCSRTSKTNTVVAPNRYDHLTHLMLQKSSTDPPKSRGRASEVRGLVPYGAEAAVIFLDKHDMVEASVIALAQELNNCYELLSHSVYNSAAMATHAKRFAAMAIALESHTAPPDWQTKPKVHLFLELTEHSLTNPSSNWCYRDEDCGGALALQARRKGGSLTAKATSLTLLNKFCAKHMLPRIS